MPTVKLNNLNFHYEIEGKGPPLLLIAGLGCDSSHWNFVKPLLVKTFQVITLDNRSVGRTETPSCSYTIREMGEDVIALLEYLNISKTHLLGHSMGGAIAQTIAHRAPRYIDRLIISNSMAQVVPRALFWLHHCANLYDAHKPLEETMSIVAPWVFSNMFFTDPKKVEKLLSQKKAYSYQQSASGFRQQVEAVASFDSRSWIDQLSLPSCIITGKEDILTPLEGAQYLHQHIKNSQLLIQEGAHSPMFEIPEEYADAIKNFLLQ